ncbi:MAG TPA: dodecin family protein [Bacteroidales bacterium]|nr:dodecin family protein [Bacteroidales bacterium]
MAVLKVIEIMASSPKSWEDAAETAVKTAGKTVKGIRSVYVQDMSAVVKDNKITEFRANLKISFEVINE